MPLHSRTESICLYQGGNERLYTQVGQRIDNVLKSTGQAGFLMFGPYIPVKPGNYQVLIHGALGEGGAAGAYIDIVADRGNRTLAKSALEPPADADTLISIPIFLDAPCKDMEVRVWVEASSDVTVSLLEIRRLDDIEEETSPVSDIHGYASELPLDRELVVVDVGCRWGFAEKFTSEPGRFRVFGFDPDIEECERLRFFYNSNAVTIVPLALAGTIDKRKLFITHEPACSSLLRPDPRLTENYPALSCAREVASSEIDTITLDKWSETHDVQSIDYMKIDTQGSELEILIGGINILKTVRALEIEVEFNPIYLGQPVFSDIDLFLRAEGFVLWKLTNQVHYSKGNYSDEPIGEDSVYYDDKSETHKLFGGQLYWANAHYIRKSIIDAEDCTETQKNRDIVLFQALGMPDVVDHIRYPLVRR